MEKKRRNPNSLGPKVGLLSYLGMIVKTQKNNLKCCVRPPQKEPSSLEKSYQ
jgi:hypothetical protein